MWSRLTKVSKINFITAIAYTIVMFIVYAFTRPFIIIPCIVVSIICSVFYYRDYKSWKKLSRYEVKD